MDESITLYNQTNGSDKVYKVDLIARDGGFLLSAWSGRRGGALKEQPKITSPVPYAQAKAAYDSLVKSKLKGGYVPGSDGASYVSANLGEPCKISLHLLTPVPESDIEAYLSDDAWIAQEKLDGERRPVARREAVIGGNRNGLTVAMPSALAAVLDKLPMGTELDGEQIGEVLHVFDAMRSGDTDIRHLGTLDRLIQAHTLVDQLGKTPHVRVVTTAIGTEAKRALYARLRAERAEGIAFKRAHAAYSAGANGDQVKVKFVERATLCVASVHPSKRSVAVQAFQPDGSPLPLGNVTIPANYPIPAVSEVVEVAYLYVVRSLIQPCYLGVRTDRSLSHCTTAQLKYRADIAADDEPAVEASDSRETPLEQLSLLAA